MSNKFVALALISVCASVSAASIEELAKKNSELLEVKADLAIATARADLQKLRQADPSIASTISNNPAAKLKPVKPSPTIDIDGVEFIGAGGDYSNPTGKFLIGSGTVMKKQGEMLNGWMLVKLTASEANFTKPGKGEVLQKTIYLSSVNRLSGQSSPAGQSTNVIRVPAVMQQPPIR